MQLLFFWNVLLVFFCSRRLLLLLQDVFLFFMPLISWWDSIANLFSLQEKREFHASFPFHHHLPRISLFFLKSYTKRNDLQMKRPPGSFFLVFFLLFFSWETKRVERITFIATSSPSFFSLPFCFHHNHNYPVLLSLFLSFWGEEKGGSFLPFLSFTFGRETKKI